MKAATLIAAGMAVLPSLVAAHANAVPGAPSVFGRRDLNDLRSLKKRHPHRAAKRRASPTGEDLPSKVKPRQASNTDGPCGAGVGSCATGYCCSPAGWCGTTEDYCSAPLCQFNYGSGCDTNQVPPGPVTSNVARTHVGSVPYGGAGIYDCTVEGTLALTFDDGPSQYTSAILDVLEKYNVPATFFITGNNNGKGQIDDAAFPWAALIQRMHTAGHQIASHTWSHQDLGSKANTQGEDVLTTQQRLNQMYYNEIAFNNILGFFPTYMRPPYSDCDSACQSTMSTLGYHIIYFDLDTEDYLRDAPNLIQQSKNDFSGNISTSTPTTGDWLVISHDILEQTANNLTEYMVTTALAAGWKLVTVGECLGDPAANWYRTLGGGSLFTSTPSAAASSTTSAPTATPTAASPDGSCGGSTGYYCTGTSYGNCCSANGWCGSTSDYCSTGCQAAFGLCGSETLSATSTTSSAAAAPTAISNDGSCGGTTGFTCQGSTFGNCCSPGGWCGSTTDYCSTGCQPAFGSCGTSSSGTATGTSSAPAASSTLKVSTDGACGGTTGETCLGSTFGSCCSPAGWCGSTSAYCGNGCQLSYGSCTVSSSSSASNTGGVTSTITNTITSTSTMTTSTTKTSSTTTKTSSTTTTKTTSSSTALPTSTAGKCGAAVGQTCSGTKYGNCCGSANTCGSGLQCIIGCQTKYSKTGSCL